MAYTTALKAVAARCAGSSPVPGTYSICMYNTMEDIG